jgi:dTDP-4-amino-4,6-dideoxygalactose transaminase
MYRGLESARKTNLPFADDISHRILCLPIFDSLTDDDIDRVIQIITTAASETF